MDTNNNLLIDISQLIDSAKINTARSINRNVVTLYWHIGKSIKKELMMDARAEYGSQLVNDLSRKLSEKYGRGYSRRNIFNMISLYEVFPDFDIVQSLTAQLSVTHLLELIKIKELAQRQFYLTMCANENWSVRVLKEKINSMLFERTLISQKPEQTIVNDLNQLSTENIMSTDLFFRDPYILDFLGLKDTYSEKDLENAILAELEKFILEMGFDFAFLARQKRIVIDLEDHYIDLLFYHRKMRRLVVIELKLGKFKAEYKGQIELYLRWLEKNEKTTEEESPVGIILCAEKSSETVELLKMDKSGIHVAQFITSLPSKELFEQKLHEAIAKAKYRLALDNNKEDGLQDETQS